MLFSAHILRIGLIVLFAAVAAGGFATWAFASMFIRPDNHDVPLPEGFPAQPVSIPGKKRTVAGWWIDRGLDAPAVLLLHALHSDRSSMIGRAKLLDARGYSVLLIDLQAHGETPGDVVTFGRRESADVQAALRWLKAAAPSRRVGVIGWSLGGASVVLGPQPSGFDAVVLESVYPRITRAIENRIHMRLHRRLVPLLRPLLTSQLTLRLHVTPRDLRPVRSIARLGAPVLIVAGALDLHTTLEESQELFEAAVEPKEMWVLDGAMHEDFQSVDPAGYESNVVEFLDRHLRDSWPHSV